MDLDQHAASSPAFARESWIEQARLSQKVETIATNLAWDAHDEIYSKLPPMRQRDYREAAIAALRLTDPEIPWRKLAMLLALEHGAGKYAELFTGDYEAAEDLKPAIRGRLYHLLTGYAVALLARLTDAIPVLPHEYDLAAAQAASVRWMTTGRLGRDVSCDT